MWYPRHQRDMAPILAAAELAFDSALDIFAKVGSDDARRFETC